MKRLIAAAALSLSLFTAVAGAQENPVNTGALTFSGDAVLTTAYIFRGINYEDTGIIVQPTVTAYLKWYETDTMTLTPFAGTWESWQENVQNNPAKGSFFGTGAPNHGSRHFFESDYYLGFDLGMHPWNFTVIYDLYTFPSGAYDNFQEIGFKASYDLDAMIRRTRCPVHTTPYAAYYYEISNNNPGGRRQYLELGLDNDYRLRNSRVTLSFPVKVGLSPDGYYTDDSGHDYWIGYGSVGALAHIPLHVPTKYGKWRATAGLTYYEFFANNTRSMNNEDYRFVGTVGIGFTY